MDKPTMSKDLTKCEIFYVKNNSSRIQGAITLSPKKMKELNIEINDTVLVEGKYNKKSICIVNSRKGHSDFKVGMNEVLRNNLRVRENALVYIHKFPLNNIPKVDKIVVKPVNDTHGLKTYWPRVMKSFLNLTERETTVLTKGNNFVIEVDSKIFEFKIMNTSSSPYCLVTKNTFIQCKGNLTD